MILARIICLVAGYGFGIMQTAYIYGKLHGIDIREHGSGNSGTTNALRVLGKKAGLIVFLGDLMKAIVLSVIVRIVMGQICPTDVHLYLAYAGFGTVLGHNFPFYMNFKGGKGIATTAGVIVGFLDPVMIVTCLVAFILVVAITRYVSLGSIVVVTMFMIEYAIFALNGKYEFDFSVASSHQAMIESVIVVSVISIMAIIRHHANINRLIHHTENKLGAKKES